MVQAISVVTVQVKHRANLLKKIEVQDGVGGLSTPTLVDTDFDGELMLRMRATVEQ